MPSKRDVLTLLSRDELFADVHRCDLASPDLVDTAASSKRATLAEPRELGPSLVW